jgi:hypothetical protein
MATFSGRPGRAGRPNNSSIVVDMSILSSSAIVVVGVLLLLTVADSFVVNHNRVAVLDNDVNEVVVVLRGANAIDVVNRVKNGTMHDGTSFMVATRGLFFSAP